MNRRSLARWNNKARASATAAKNRAAHFERRDKEAKMAPKKPKFVAEVPLTINFGGEIVGTAKIEQLPGGDCIAHIDASEMTADMLRRGFSIGDFSIPDPEITSIQLEKDSAIDTVRNYGKDGDDGRQGPPREHPSPDPAREGD